MEPTPAGTPPAEAEPFDVFCYAVYFNPNEYPGEWVVRRWHLREGLFYETSLWSKSPTYDAAAATIPPGLTKVSRHDAGQPEIWETWM